jgi:hypothetical protein
VEVFGRGIPTELRYSGGHLSALVADYDVKFIDAAYGDGALIFSNRRCKPLIKDTSNSRLAEWKAWRNHLGGHRIVSAEVPQPDRRSARICGGYHAGELTQPLAEQRFQPEKPDNLGLPCMTRRNEDAELEVESRSSGAMSASAKWSNPTRSSSVRRSSIGL